MPEKIYKYLIFALSGILLNIGIIHAKDQQTLFSDTTLIHIIVKGDFDSILVDISDEREKHDAEIYICDNNWKVQYNLELKIKTRGNFRRKPQNCNFPPLRFYFKEKNSINTIFEGIDKIKLVSHCQNDLESYKQGLLKEYLLYQTYSLITPFSLKTRLAKIKYVDTNDGVPSDTITTYAFFIEHDEDFASRNDSELIESEEIFLDGVDFDQAMKLFLFEYMIGNNDWSIVVAHNIKFIDTGKSDKLIPIPYDFDWAGIINNPYMMNVVDDDDPDFPTPIYKGFCVSRKTMRLYRDFYNSKKEEIYALYLSFDYLSHQNKFYTIRFLDRFYSNLNDYFSYSKYFKDKCINLD